MKRLALTLMLVAGCGAPPEPPRGAGAREAAAAFFDGIARQDWSAAFDVLDADSRKIKPAAFAERAKSYRKNLGFELAKVHVRLCEEQGDKANAHVVLMDQNESRKHAFRDAITLRKEGEKWGVTLPANFGVKR